MMRSTSIGQSATTCDSLGLQPRLANVFRILADPKHKLWEEAAEWRDKVSSTWAMLAAQEQWFAWPTTSASPGICRLKHISAPDEGMLSFLGYHVGEGQPTRREIRSCILDYIFECHLPPLNDSAYYSEWGAPQSARRLSKLANTLAAFARNAKRRNAVSHAKAIDDWERDLTLLHDKYYLGYFHFGWPDTMP